MNITQGKSFISWIGGKSRLSKQLIPLIPEHQCYAEVFAGAGWLLFRKEPSQVELLNDINSDLVTLYRVVKHHLREFIRCFENILIARDEFERFKLERPEALTDIQRAVRFYYLAKTSHGGKVADPHFGTATTRGPRLNLLRIEHELSDAYIRLAKVTIENLPYAAFIQRYDREHTFFYVDPPYYGCEDYYGKGLFSRADFEVLADLLEGIKGRFLVSLNDTPEIREIFRRFEIMEVPTKYSMGKSGGQKPVVELAIANYSLEAMKKS